jgi:alkanesulfonate monooxygenase SsuD/methylene tetrahydromethanopterin reductase-like flavin-dependent oxidoreductase (luciferase family)
LTGKAHAPYYKENKRKEFKDMVALSIMIEGQNGLTWPHWKRIIREVEDLSFAGLFRSDHFKHAQPPDDDALELMVSLTYLADHTQRLHFGSLVAPVSFRDPVMQARQAAALDDLSGGRMILGVGAGWQAREHHLFGYSFGDVPTRMARLQDGLEVITRLLRSGESATYGGGSSMCAALPCYHALGVRGSSHFDWRQQLRTHLTSRRALCRHLEREFSYTGCFPGTLGDPRSLATDRRAKSR